MKKKIFLGCLVSATFISQTTLASGGHHYHSKADDHFPVGVMGGHTHAKGEWMTSYRFGKMEMDKIISGNTNLTAAEARSKGFMMSPISMTMEMHMFGLMYGATDKLTIAAMLPQIRKKMVMENGSSVRSINHAKGVGDAKFTGLYSLVKNKTERLHLNLGVSLPSGSIKEKNASGTKLGYNMQLGSGTYDPILGATYVKNFNGFSWGTQFLSNIRMGKNSQGYRLGNEYNLTSYIAKNLNQYSSLSFRINGKKWGDIKGQDIELNAAMTPVNRADLRAGEKVDALIGLNLIQPHGVLAGHRLAVEFGKPIYQYYDGPTLEADYQLTIGWQYAF